MLPTHQQLRTFLHRVIADKAEQGHVTDGLETELDALPASYDALDGFSRRLADLPLRDNCPYVEPDDFASIKKEWDPGGAAAAALDDETLAGRVRAAFLGRVCGCMLGKPFEIDASHDTIRTALEQAGEWPLADYPSEAALRCLPTLQGQWRELAREHITHVAPDDDINYTILAMLLLEGHGTAFTHDDMRRIWLMQLVVPSTFGPERTILVRSAIHSLGDERPAPHEEWADILNPGAELCGALIRADAYGYACVGRPELAAELAHRDASFTHRRTGVYGAMFVAAAIAIAPLLDDRLDIVREALRFVPQRSRFAERTRECLTLVEGASDWIDGYQRVHERFGEYGFCHIYQEVGTLINTLRFASDLSDGICIQVMQGLDTDSFGATAGSILGAHFGPGHLDDRFVTPLEDTVHAALGLFYERSLDRIADRLAALPARVRSS